MHPANGKCHLESYYAIDWIVDTGTPIWLPQNSDILAEISSHTQWLHVTINHKITKGLKS